MCTFIYQCLSIYAITQRLSRKIPSRPFISMAHHMFINNSNAVKYAVELLSFGDVIAVPTDTVYGFACNATDFKAVNKLYTIKGRSENKPLAICVSRVEDIRNWAQVDHLPQGLLSTLLPGPVTLVLQYNSRLEHSLASSEGKIGVRVPKSEFIQNIVTELGSPLALTSANTSGNPSSITISEFQELWSQLSCVFDQGVIGSEKNREASTVVDLSYPGFYHIIRLGIAAEKTAQVLNSYGLENRN